MPNCKLGKAFRKKLECVNFLLMPHLPNSFNSQNKFSVYLREFSLACDNYDFLKNYIQQSAGFQHWLKNKHANYFLWLRSILYFLSVDNGKASEVFLRSPVGMRTKNYFYLPKCRPTFFTNVKRSFENSLVNIGRT